MYNLSTSWCLCTKTTPEHLTFCVHFLNYYRHFYYLFYLSFKFSVFENEVTTEKIKLCNKELYKLHCLPHIIDNQVTEKEKDRTCGTYLGADKCILNTGVEPKRNRYLEDHRHIHTYTQYLRNNVRNYIFDGHNHCDDEWTHVTHSPTSKASKIIRRARTNKPTF